MKGHCEWSQMLRDEVREGGRATVRSWVLFYWNREPLEDFQTENKCLDSHLRKITLTAVWIMDLWGQG